MRNHVKTAPSIRFKGFTEDWEQHKLGDLAESFNYGLNARATEFDGENKYIRITDIDDKSHKFIQSGLTSPNAELSNADDYLLKEGDILFARTGASVGKSYQYDRLDGKVYYAGFLIRARIKPEFNPSFIFQNTVTERYKNFIKIASQRSGQPGVNAQEYANFSLLVPTKEEQSQIGAFFKQLDTTITLQQQQLSNYKEMKKALLQKMFPQNGEKMPEVRFEGFTGEWEERKLGEVVLITMGQSPNGENYTDNPKDHILVQGNADMKRGRVVPRVWTTQVTKTAEPEDIILSVRAPVGDVGKTEYPVVLGRGVSGIKGNEFIFQALSRMKAIGFWTRYSSGSTFESINSTDLKDALIQLPCEEEQTQIGTFFKQLDDTIALQQRQLDNYKEFKKAMLQKMF